MAPPPGALASEIVPPWASMIDRTMASPSPVPPELRARLGITEGLVRLSCGVEEVEDLLADLERGFEDMPRAKSATSTREAVAAD